MNTAIPSKAAEAWDRRYLCYKRQSDPARTLEPSAPVFGFRAWFLDLFERDHTEGEN